MSPRCFAVIYLIHQGLLKFKIIRWRKVLFISPPWRHICQPEIHFVIPVPNFHKFLLRISWIYSLKSCNVWVKQILHHGASRYEFDSAVIHDEDNLEKVGSLTNPWYILFRNGTLKTRSSFHVSNDALLWFRFLAYHYAMDARTTVKNSKLEILQQFAPENSVLSDWMDMHWSDTLRSSEGTRDCSRPFATFGDLYFVVWYLWNNHLHENSPVSSYLHIIELLVELRVNEYRLAIEPDGNNKGIIFQIDVETFSTHLLHFVDLGASGEQSAIIKLKAMYYARLSVTAKYYQRKLLKYRYIICLF